MTGMPATPPSFAPGEKKGVSNVPVETVVGVALGGMAGLAVLVAAVLFLWRVAGKKRQAKDAKFGELLQACQRMSIAADPSLTEKHQWGYSLLWVQFCHSNQSVQTML